MSQSSSSSSSFVIRSPAVAAVERAVLADVLLERGDVEARLGVDPAGHVRHGRDLRPERVELVRGDAADVPEALDDAALILRESSRAGHTRERSP